MRSNFSLYETRDLGADNWLEDLYGIENNKNDEVLSIPKTSIELQKVVVIEGEKVCTYNLLKLKVPFSVCQ